MTSRGIDYRCRKYGRLLPHLSDEIGTASKALYRVGCGQIKFFENARHATAMNYYPFIKTVSFKFVFH
jgi:hypothetical protein